MPPDDDLDLDDVDQLDPSEIEALPPEDEEEPDDPDSQDDDGESEGGDEGEGADEQQDDLAASQDERNARVVSRGSDRIRALNARLKAAEREREAANRRLDEMLQQRRSGDQPLAQHVESEAQRQARRSAMSPEERLSEDLKESERRIQAQLHTAQAVNWDNSDRAFFEAKATTDSLYRRWGPRVEQELVKLREKGTPAPREAILKFLLGSAMLDQRGKGKGKKRKQAERRLRSQETRPRDSRGDQGAQRRSGNRSLEDRLSDVSI